MHYARWILSMALTALILSCGGGDGGGGGIPGPTYLRSISDSGFRGFTLTWTPPTGPFDGYNLEAKSGSQGFERIHTGLLPADYTSIVFYFNDGAPEDVVYTFRINAAKGTKTSVYSNTVTGNSGLTPPGQPTGQYDWDRGGVALSWTKNSIVSTEFVLERAVADSYGSPLGSWTELSVSDPLSSAYLDTGVSMGTRYTYRVTNRKGSATSLPSPASSAIYVGLATPGQPTATFDFDAGAMRITWAPNMTQHSGSKIERSQASGEYGVPVGDWTEVATLTSKDTTFLDTSCPLNQYFSYRISNVRNDSVGTSSMYSYGVYAGLLPPSHAHASWDQTINGVKLEWYSYDSFDSFLVERADADSTGQVIGAWEILENPPGATNSIVDTSINELAYYVYRVSSCKGRFVSSPCITYAVKTYLLAPINLSVSSTPEGARLTWQNKSNAAAQILVARGPWNDSYREEIALLSNSDTNYTDPVGQLGYYHYRVVAKNQYDESTSSPAAYVTPNGADALALSQVTRSYPDADDGSLAPSGAWGLASAAPFGMISNGDPWTPYFPGDRVWNAQRMVRVDPQGRPHIVYAATDPSNPAQCAIRHAWYDGSVWKSEVVGSTQRTYYSTNSVFQFELDSSGAPHLVFDSGNSYVYPETIDYYYKLNGVWTKESMAGLNLPSMWVSCCRIIVDRGGNPTIFLSMSNIIYECRRDGQGGWTASEAVSTSSGVIDILGGKWSDVDNGVILYVDANYTAEYSQNLTEIKKIAGEWQSPQVIYRKSGGNSTMELASSHDASRMAVACQDSYGLKLLHRDDAGWHQTLVANPADSYNSWFRLGFDSGGKVHLLHKNTYPASGYTEFIEQ